MTSRHTTWALAVSLLAHLVVLGWMPSFRGTVTWRPAQDQRSPERTLHAVLLPLPSPTRPPPDQETPPARAAVTAPGRSAPAGGRPPPLPSLVTHAAPEAPAPTEATVSTAAPVSATPSPFTAKAPAQPLDLELPQRRSIHAPRLTAGMLASKGPVTPEPSAAQAIMARQSGPPPEVRSDPVSVHERRSASQTQAEVRTPWGRYCMRDRTSSRMAELHDSPFAKGLQVTTCPDG